MKTLKMEQDMTIGKSQKSRVVATTKPVEPYLVCPECGSYPLRLTGEKTLCMPKNCKAVCDYCNYQRADD